jgi:TPR repeat protein
MLQLGSAALSDHAGKSDPLGAFVWFKKAADVGNIVGAFNVGQMYRMGLGVPKNERLAAYWYEKAANAGFPAAEVNLGVMKLRGMGIDKNAEAGIALIRSAASKGNQQAQKLEQELKNSGVIPKNG